jgi:hypothetical protein
MEDMKAIKIFLKEALAGKDCIGSINAYCNRLNGFLVLDELVFEQLLREASLMFSLAKFEKKSGSDAEFILHDKWGRAESFLLFD